MKFWVSIVEANSDQKSIHKLYPRRNVSWQYFSLTLVAWVRRDTRGNKPKINQNEPKINQRKTTISQKNNEGKQRTNYTMLLGEFLQAFYEIIIELTDLFALIGVCID